jgi:hypothetical protein
LLFSVILNKLKNLNKKPEKISKSLTNCTKKRSPTVCVFSAFQVMGNIFLHDSNFSLILVILRFWGVNCWGWKGQFWSI